MKNDTMKYEPNMTLEQRALLAWADLTLADGEPMCLTSVPRQSAAEVLIACGMLERAGPDRIAITADGREAGRRGRSRAPDRDPGATGLLRDRGAALMSAPFDHVRSEALLRERQAEQTGMPALQGAPLRDGLPAEPRRQAQDRALPHADADALPRSPARAVP